jgi:two-component system cell cycle response regulator
MFGKILIVDDSVVNLKLLENKLTSEFYEVIKATSGEEALKIIEEDKPDLIMLDVMMPGGMDGIETCQIIKDNPETFYLPVIIITSLTEQEEKVRGLEAGADDIIIRPINDVSLFARVNSLLRLKMMAEQWIIRETAIQENTVMPSHLDMYFGKKCRYSHILVLGETEEEILQLKTPLKEKKYKVIYTKNTNDAEELSNYKKLDLFIVSLSIGHEEALRFCSKLKNSDKNKNTPILIVGDKSDEPYFIKALEYNLAAQLAVPLTGDKEKLSIYRSIYKDELRVAKFNDSSQTPSDTFADNRYVNVRA